MNDSKVTSEPASSDSQQATAVTPDIIRSVIADLEAIATKATGDFSPETVANIALNKLTNTNGIPDSEKPAETITAAVFVRDGYVNKIAAGECIVKWGNNSIIDITFDGDSYTMWLERNRNGAVWDNDTYTVTWLTPPPAPASEPETAGAEALSLDVSAMITRDEVETLIRANNRFSAIRLLHNKNGLSIEESRNYVNKIATELSLQQTIDVSKMTLDTLQAETSALRRQLATAEGAVQALRNTLSHTELYLRLTRNALENVIDESDYAQGEWRDVQPTYAPEWTHTYKTIGDIAQQARENTEALPEASPPLSADADEGGGTNDDLEPHYDPDDELHSGDAGYQTAQEIEDQEQDNEYG